MDNTFPRLALEGDLAELFPRGQMIDVANVAMGNFSLTVLLDLGVLMSYEAFKYDHHK